MESGSLLNSAVSLAGNEKKVRAIALMSGGLDSTLAAKLILDQGIEVIGLHLVSPFSCHTEVEKTAASIGIPVIFREKGNAYFSLLEKPQYGFGKNMNPCVDCRIFMFELAEKVMEETGAQFVVTGEVLGQRPKSQVRSAIDLIENKGPLKGRVVRPLSGGFMPATEAEQKGWISRKGLLKLSGRSRKAQLQMAKDWGLVDVPTPAGGCLLTDSFFSKKLKDFLDHQDYQDPAERMVQAELLKVGRHFRLPSGQKVIVARNDTENLKLKEAFPKTRGSYCSVAPVAGPDALLFGPLDESSKEIVAQILYKYSKPQDSTLQVTVQNGKDTLSVSAKAAWNEDLLKGSYL